jgi:predicted RNA-binding Zn-ribbon protein involved in translation (DUF1610 family)
MKPHEPNERRRRTSPWRVRCSACGRGVRAGGGACPDACPRCGRKDTLYRCRTVLASPSEERRVAAAWIALVGCLAAPSTPTDE